MIERGQRPRFARETREPLGIVGHRGGKHLDCDIAVKLRVARAIDFAHPAGANGRDDLVRTETRSACECHQRCRAAQILPHEGRSGSAISARRISVRCDLIGKNARDPRGTVLALTM
jgi:hypothetical protein